MLISQKYVVNKLQKLGIILPDQPSKIDDDTVNRILIYSGPHQRLLGLARCAHVTNLGVQKLSLCHSLLFLNLSYTQVDDISSISTCVNLRGVNLAGTNLRSYDPLKWLSGLEILNLNCSSIRSIDTAGESFSELRLLRSLDLGGCSGLCSLRDLQFLASGQLTRLEELLLDGTPAQGYVSAASSAPPASSSSVPPSRLYNQHHNQRQQSVAAVVLPPLEPEAEADERSPKEVEQAIRATFHIFFDKIAQIDCLRVINIGNSPAVKYVKYLQSKISNGTTYVLSKPRSYYWFLSIINNDHEEVRAMILNGMDINCRAGQPEMDLFFTAWRERCKGKTPFFDCISEDETLRPSAVHVAVMFNSVECLKHLVKAEARQVCAVWLGRVDAESCSETDDDDSWGEGDWDEDEDRDDKIDEEDLTSESEGEGEGGDGDSLDSDDLLSLDSSRSGYAEEVQRKKEQKRASAREARRKRKEENKENKEIEAAAKEKELIDTPILQAQQRPVGRRRVASLRPTSCAAAIALKVKDMAPIAENGGSDKKNGSDKDDGSGVSVNTMSFARRVYDENVHRITERMTERRVTGWKLVAKTLLTRLENILLGEAEEFDDDYQSVASVGSVGQVSVATEIAKVKMVEAIKEEAAKKKIFSIEDIRKRFGSKKNMMEEDEEPVLLLAKDDPEVTDDDLFLCSLRRDSNGDIVGTRGQFVSEEMIRLQLESAQSERASTAAEGSLASSTRVDSKAPGGNVMFPELFAQGGEDRGGGQDDVSVITHDTASALAGGGEGEGEGRGELDELVPDEFFPHIPALEQCLPWEPLFAKLTIPVVLKMYKQDFSAAQKEEDTAPEGTEEAPSMRKASRYATKKLIVAHDFDSNAKKEGEPLMNGLGMEYVEISILGKKSFWLESKRDMLKSRIKSDELLQIEEDNYKLDRWKNFIGDSVKADGKVFGRDSRIAKPMKLLYKNNGAPLTREERKEKLAQLLKENREMYVL